VGVIVLLYLLPCAAIRSHSATAPFSGFLLVHQTLNCQIDYFILLFYCLIV
jgi:hypothetical protein